MSDRRAVLSDPVSEVASRWQAAEQALRTGGVAIIPTDTVYGLAVAPGFAASPDVLFQLKGRPSNKPVAWLVGSLEDLEQYGTDVPDWALHLAQEGWPGALTLVVRASKEVPAAFRSAEGTIGLRMPDHAGVLQLIRALGCPLATTSANLSGKPASRRFGELAPELLAQVPAVRDSEVDAMPSGRASEVVDCTADTPRILRAGGQSGSFSCA